MGVVEWVALCTLAFTVLTYIVKGYSDKASTETKLEALEKWKTKMESTEYLPIARCNEERKECRESIYKDVSRVERRFDDFLRVIEVQNTKIAEVRENVIKILTLLESKKEN